MYAENELLPISALQHLHFCPRQCAFIHVEQAWVENRYTAEGRILHEQPDKGRGERRGKLKIERDVALRSFRLGLIGKADVVEFHLSDEKVWQPFPIEYKRGRPKKDNCDRVQLCAQAICLEEMLNVEIDTGALFYGKIRRRQDVVFDLLLRKETERLATELHQLIQSGVTPKPAYSKKCNLCSFFSQCMPKQLNGKKSVEDYLAGIIEAK
jgi:CRISPR-associated exonuclease Cas4